MADGLLTLPIPGLSTAGLDRLTRAVAAIRVGKPLAHGGPLHRMRSVADGIELIELRPLLPGEQARRVDWRASARARRTMVRRYRDERSGEWLICLDASASIGAAPGCWTLARQLAGAFAYLVQHFDHRVGLALFSDRLHAFEPPGRGHSAFLRIVETLARARPRTAGGGSEPECCAPLADPGRRLLLISDCLRADAMIPALERLLARGGGIELIHLQTPPPALPAGIHAIEDAETGERRSIQTGPDCDEAVGGRQARITESLAAHCSARRIPFTRSAASPRPDDPDHWQRVVLAHVTGAASRAESGSPPG